MTDTIILGTMALDTIETPFGKEDNALGGSATYASIATSFFTKPGVVSVVGKDFPEEHIEFIKSRGINLDGVTIGDKTFRWEGSYEYDMNDAKTHKTELGDLATYQAEVPENYKDAKYAFLGNIDPEQQLKVIETLKDPKLVVMDTMNFWIDTKKQDVLNVMDKVDVLVFNEGEARLLFDTPNLITAGRQALRLVNKAVIIKKGEHGALLFNGKKIFSAPSYPLEQVKDPTGCGDCFGGGFTGYLAKTDDLSESNMRKAIVYGSVIASHNAEGFGTENLRKIDMKDIEKRYDGMKQIREF